MDGGRTDEVWILGATGRVGRALAERLSVRDEAKLALVSRTAEDLHRMAEPLGPKVRALPLGDFCGMVDAVRREKPRVVINLIGSYSDTAAELARACMPGGSYIDLANDLTSMQAMLDLHGEAVENQATLITGAGFGVLGTEAVVARICNGRPVPVSVRVDAVGSFASAEGVMGEAFADTSVGVITTGGRTYRDGRLVPTRLASHVRHLSLPDGTAATTATVPSGELLAARRISGAPNVDFTSALAPTSPALRAVLPVMTVLLRLRLLRRLMIKQLAMSKTRAAPRPRPHSWGHAVATWPDGSVREGWLRAGDAMEFTADALSVIATKLISEAAPYGAFTPAAAFGPEIAVAAGATLLGDAPVREHEADAR